MGLRAKGLHGELRATGLGAGGRAPPGRLCCLHCVPCVQGAQGSGVEDAAERLQAAVLRGSGVQGPWALGL